MKLRALFAENGATLDELKASESPALDATSCQISEVVECEELDERCRDVVHPMADGTPQ